MRLSIDSSSAGTSSSSPLPTSTLLSAAVSTLTTTTTTTTTSATSDGSPALSETSDLGAAASALFNLRASPVVLSQKQILSHNNKNMMPFLSLSPPVLPPPPPATTHTTTTTRARAQTWDASISTLPSLGFLQQLVDRTDTSAAGTLCALMQSDSPLIMSINAKQQQQQQQQQRARRPRSQSVAPSISQQERQNLKGLRPRSLSSMADPALLGSPVPMMPSSSSSSRRRSRTMSMDSSVGGGAGGGEDDYYYDYMDEDEEEEEEEEEDEEDGDEVGTVVSLEIVGKYSPDSRRRKIERFAAKRMRRIWRKRIKYDVRKNFADSRLRVKGRFVRKEDEDQLRDYLNMT